MKSFITKLGFLSLILLLSHKPNTQEFQGQAFYYTKSKAPSLGRWGARLSEAQKKQVQARLKNRLEKSYVLSFNKEASVFKEKEKIDAISGATDSWGSNFSRGKQYKNIKENALVQAQEFYGKKFLVKDKLQKIDWKLDNETKQIGKYTCFKATASIPTEELTWYIFSWSDLRSRTQTESASENGEATSIPEVKMTEVEAWYTPQIPVGHGPAEFWGLPGLILEVRTGDTTMLCSEILINPEKKIKIEAPDKGKVTTKSEYQATIINKMKEFRDNRGRRRN